MGSNPTLSAKLQCSQEPAASSIRLKPAFAATGAHSDRVRRYSAEHAAPNIKPNSHSRPESGEYEAV